MTPQKLKNIIHQGEGETIEFKLSFSKSVIISLTAFSNTKGGKVLIGINDNGKAEGVSIENESVQKWINEIKQNTIPQLIPNACQYL